MESRACRQTSEPPPRKRLARPLERCLGWADEETAPVARGRRASLWEATSAGATREAKRAAVAQRVAHCFDDAIKQLQLESAMVTNGTHSELLSQGRGLKRKREQTKRSAVANLESRQQLVQQLLDHEVAQLHQSYNACLDKVKERLTVELNHRHKTLENRRDGVAEEPRMNTRSLRSKTKGDPDEGDLDVMGQKSQHAGAALLGLGQQAVNKQRRKTVSPASSLLDKLLDDEEIHQDLYDIKRDELQHAEAKPQEVSLQLNIKLGQLKIANEQFNKGDQVTVWAVGGPVAMSGVIQSINNTEVHLKLADSTKHRVYLSHLRNGRAMLVAGTPNQAPPRGP